MDRGRASPAPRVSEGMISGTPWPSRTSSAVGFIRLPEPWMRLFDGIHLLVVGLDAAGHVVFANPHLLKLTGYEAAEVIGADWFTTFVDPVERITVRSVFDELKSGGASESFVNTIVTKQGARRRISWHNVHLPASREMTARAVSIGEDISERTGNEARLTALNEVMTAILSDGSGDAALHHIARWARTIAGADVATIALPHGQGTLRLAAVDGQRAERLRQMTFPVEESISGAVLGTGKSEIVEDASEDARVFQPVVALGGFGPAIFVPLTASGRTFGTIAVYRLRGGLPFSAEDLELVTSFAAHAAVAAEYARTQRELQRLRVYEERERIARDLHDRVIQRVFAVGLNLEAAGALADGRETLLAERLNGAVRDLDETIEEIRAVIFSLEPREERQGTRAAIRQLVQDAELALGFKPEVRFRGGVESLLSDSLSSQIVAVVNEGLGNAIHHAHATSVEILVAVGDEVIVRVIDDGVGMHGGWGRLSGLRDLADRARSLGGTFSVGGGRDGGTSLEWRVPIGANGS